MGKRTRDRQLAKLAAQRRAQRERERRRRRAAILTGVGIGVVAIAVVVLAFFVGGDDPSPSADASPSASPSPVPEQAACGAKPPPSAGEQKPSFPEPPAMQIDPKVTYTARMRTSCGTIELELDADGAPTTVNSFVFLAREGFYDGLTFHRIVPGFVIQGGDPVGDGTGGPGYQFENEQAKGETFDGAGVLAMANSGPDTNGSQFFITLAKSDALTPDLYTIFGRVRDGQRAVDAIAAVPLEGETPVDPVYIESVKISES